MESDSLQPGLHCGWLGGAGAASNTNTNDEKGAQSHVFLNLMKLNLTSDYGTWQRWPVLGQKAALLLVTQATFFSLFSSPPANRTTAADIHQSLDLFGNVHLQGRTVSFKLCGCAAWKIQHSTTCAVMESIETFIVLRKDTVELAHAAVVVVSAIHPLELNHGGKIHIPFSSASCYT